MILKVFNYIKIGLTWLKDIFELGKWVIMIFLAVSTFSGIKSCSNQKEQKQNAVTIAKDESVRFETESGKHALEKKQWVIERKELKEEITEKDALGSQYLNEIKNLQNTILDLNIKNKRLESANKTLLESSDSVRTEFIFLDCETIEIKPIRKKHIKIDFKQDGNILDVYYKYNAEITTIVHRDKNPNQFILWRWINPDWIYKSTTIIDDPNATIINNLNVDFD